MRKIQLWVHRLKQSRLWPVGWRWERKKPRASLRKYTPQSTFVWWHLLENLCDIKFKFKLIDCHSSHEQKHKVSSCALTLQILFIKKHMGFSWSSATFRANIYIAVIFMLITYWSAVCTRLENPCGVKIKVGVIAVVIHSCCLHHFVESKHKYHFNESLQEYVFFSLSRAAIKLYCENIVLSWVDVEPAQQTQ